MVERWLNDGRTMVEMAELVRGGGTVGPKSLLRPVGKANPLARR